MLDLNGYSEIIPHIGFPTHSFKAPMIYNPYFESMGINTAVIPMGCKSEHFDHLLKSLFKLENIRGALITMPHKVSVVNLLTTSSAAVKVAGACNAVKRGTHGELVGDLFDGEGFVRGICRKGFNPRGKKALIVGCGGVGSAIAASLAQAGLQSLQLFDVDADSADQLVSRLIQHFPNVIATVGSNSPTGFDLVVNASPLGMNPDEDPLPIPVDQLSSNTFVGEVVMKVEMTPLLQAAVANGCPYQVGTDMLFEQIPAYLEFFDFPSTDADTLKRLARLTY